MLCNGLVLSETVNSIQCGMPQVQYGTVPASPARAVRSAQLSCELHGKERPRTSCLSCPVFQCFSKARQHPAGWQQAADRRPLSSIATQQCGMLSLPDIRNSIWLQLPKWALVILFVCPEMFKFENTKVYDFGCSSYLVSTCARCTTEYPSTATSYACGLVLYAAYFTPPPQPIASGVTSGDLPSPGTV